MLLQIEKIKNATKTIECLQKKFFSCKIFSSISDINRDSLKVENKQKKLITNNYRCSDIYRLQYKFSWVVGGTGNRGVVPCEVLKV